RKLLGHERLTPMFAGDQPLTCRSGWSPGPLSSEIESGACAMKPWRTAAHKVRKDHSPECSPESLRPADSPPMPTSALLIHARARTAATSPRHQAEPPGTAWSPGSPVPFSEGSALTGFAAAKRERVPWRTVGTGIASLGTPAAIWILCPVLGAVIAAI